MSNKFIIFSLCIIATTFIMGWEVAVLNNEYSKCSHITQAVPVIRFERFDQQRNALIIGLFNPGTLPLEVNRTELSFQRDDKLFQDVFSYQEYDKKPLVLDPGDTILIPLKKKQTMAFQSEKGEYWGLLYFNIPGQSDVYSLLHRFSDN